MIEKISKLKKGQTFWFKSNGYDSWIEKTFFYHSQNLFEQKTIHFSDNTSILRDTIEEISFENPFRLDNIKPANEEISVENIHFPKFDYKELKEFAISYAKYKSSTEGSLDFDEWFQKII